ncbi:Nucleic acid-binding proteins superfamily isoform 1 [Cucumis melo var. makuwa]|uniref:Nucleic acid-binding proteins superfamily isoform 1 n=1 Tax=Cucumis melo var. makuwa TaxID=1194695 RepID=A0A5A7U7H0_CUCMM|nr:Nucleic acid-binding proteins superfamily isoform 1 [Cucumis melo var. makuwa]
MSSLSKHFNSHDAGRYSAMELDDPRKLQEEGDDDPFLKFVDYARSVLAFEDDEDFDPNVNGTETDTPGWSWIASRVLRTCIAYSSSVTPAILLSELSQAWYEQHRVGAPKKIPECINQLKKKNRRKKLPKTVTIDSIYEKNFLSISSVLEAVILDEFILPGTNIHMLTLGDFWSSNTIDLYLHRRFYDLVDGILKKGRQIFVTGCYLRAASGGSGYPRLLPTEYLVILLDEEEDDDVMLLGAQFCSDTFSSVSLDSVNEGTTYSLYARIESIGPLEIHEKINGLRMIQIILVDNDGFKLKFLLWGEQVLLANLLSVGSVLALDRPYVATVNENGVGTSEELCLEYGSATQLYLVPCIQHEEQVCVLTQNINQASRTVSMSYPTQGPQVSQVSLPCDSHGAIDFGNYPFRSFVIDLQDKMTGISLYGNVLDIANERNTTEAGFSMRIEDNTGEILAKLRFERSWSLGRVSVGHTVFISGLTCTKNKNRLEALWIENHVGASFVNLSCLPALLTSSCLHKLSRLSDLTSNTHGTKVCRVRLDQVSHCHVSTKFLHAICGHFVEETPARIECSFCCCECKSELVRTFDLKITLADDSAKIFAWCMGQTAAELLQISPDEFCELPEEEQVMYPSSLENENFVVAIVNCRRQSRKYGNNVNFANDPLSWEITRALKCE